MSLTPQHLAKLADICQTAAWAVYLNGIGDVFLCPDDHRATEPCKPFDRAGAVAFAAQTRANVAHAQAMHGTAIPDVTPILLCYGIPWEAL